MNELVKIPKIGDLYSNKELTLKNSAMAQLLNNEPAKHWIKEHPTTHLKYIPIEIVEFLLTRIFGKWRVEVKSSVIVANSIQVIVRLWYIDPISGEWDWQDGIGAAPLQTDKGAGAIEFDKLKASSVMMAAPSAESFAIKDAAEKLGKLFGKDLNRKDAQVYDTISKQAAERFSKLDEQ